MKRTFTLQLKAYDLHTRKYVSYRSEMQAVTLKPGQNTELGAIKNPPTITEESLVVMCATLIDPLLERPEARVVNWPEPFRYLQWHPETKVDITVEKAEAGREWMEVRVVANHPVKGCMLYVGYDDGEDAQWEDNMLDLMPGEELVTRAKGLNGRTVKARFLSDWELR